MKISKQYRIHIFFKVIHLQKTETTLKLLFFSTIYMHVFGQNYYLVLFYELLTLISPRFQLKMLVLEMRQTVKTFFFIYFKYYKEIMSILI